MPRKNRRRGGSCNSSLARSAAGSPRPEYAPRNASCRSGSPTRNGNFASGNRVIQEAAQYALAQIERTLVAVIRQVAESRGMNLVLHRNQVALNVHEFDLTEQVATQLNKILPTVGKIRPTERNRRNAARPRVPDALCRRAGATGPASAGKPARAAAPPPRHRHPRRRPLRTGASSAASPERGAGVSRRPYREILASSAPDGTVFPSRSGRGRARGGPAAAAMLLHGGRAAAIRRVRRGEFPRQRRYLSALAETRAGAVIMHPDLAGRVPEGSVADRDHEPYGLGAGRGAVSSSAPASPASIRRRLSARPP